MVFMGHVSDDTLHILAYTNEARGPRFSGQLDIQQAIQCLDSIIKDSQQY